MLSQLQDGALLHYQLFTLNLNSINNVFYDLHLESKNNKLNEERNGKVEWQ